jgi:hypothetical protein
MSLLCMMILAVVNPGDLQPVPTANGCWRVYSYYQEMEGNKSSEKCTNQYVILTDEKLIDCNLERGKTQVASYDLLDRSYEPSSTHSVLSHPFIFGQPIGNEMVAHFDAKKPRVCRFRFGGRDADRHPLVVVYFAERLSNTNDAMTSLNRELQSVFENPQDFKRLEKSSPTNSDAPSNGYWNVEAIRIQNGSEFTDLKTEKRLVMLSDGYFFSPVFQKGRWVGGYEYAIQAQDLSDGIRRCILNTPFEWGGSLQRKMTVRYVAESDRAEIEFNGTDKSCNVTLLLKRLSDDERDKAIGEMSWHRDLFVAAKRPQQ